MDCPRCSGRLATFTAEATGGTAVVCESCGFAGVPATHRSEVVDAESWERAIERFEETVLPPERTCRTDRTEGVTVPTGDSGGAIDPDRLEERVTVAPARDRSGTGNGDEASSESGDHAGSNPEETDE